MGWATLTIVGGFGLLAWLLHEELRWAGQWSVEVLGYAGIGVGIMASDMFTLPIPPDFYLAVAVTGGLGALGTIASASAGSILGGIGAFAIGRWLGNARFTARLVTPFRERGTRLVQRYGSVAVIIAALTPIPFSIVCTLTGMMGMRWGRFLPATLFRIPRFVLYFYAIQLGWSITGG